MKLYGLILSSIFVAQTASAGIWCELTSIGPEPLNFTNIETNAFLITDDYKEVTFLTGGYLDPIAPPYGQKSSTVTPVETGKGVHQINGALSAPWMNAIADLKEFNPDLGYSFTLTIKEQAGDKFDASILIRPTDVSYYVPNMNGQKVVTYLVQDIPKEAKDRIRGNGEHYEFKDLSQEQIVHICGAKSERCEQTRPTKIPCKRIH